MFIWFKQNNLRGESLWKDTGMFTFNYALVVAGCSFGGNHKLSSKKSEESNKKL